MPLDKSTGPTKIVVIGAGAKAAAIVARASVLRQLSPVGAPEVIVLEKKGPAAAWDGSSGFTDGDAPLCSPADMDVAHPFLTDGHRFKADFAQHVADLVYNRFSWKTFLGSEAGSSVSHDCQVIIHRLWAEYLKWVFGRAGIEPRLGTVKKALYDDNAHHWRIYYINNDTKTMDEMVCDAIVLTGTGVPKAPKYVSVPNFIREERIFDAVNFWKAAADLADDHVGVGNDDESVAVIGDGGAAAAIIERLLVPRQQQVGYRNLISICPKRIFYAQTETPLRMEWDTNPAEEWVNLSPETKRHYLGHADRGAISKRLQEVIDHAVRSRLLLQLEGRVDQVEWSDVDGMLRLSSVRNDGQTGVLSVRYAIFATGFDPWSLLDLTPQAAALAQKEVRERNRESIEEAVGHDLTLPTRSPFGFPPRLHVPGLASHVGPGFQNLRSLGLTAARILDRYVMIH